VFKEREALLLSMREVLEDQSDTRLFFLACELWRKHAFRCSVDPRAFFVTERQICRDAQMCLLHYRILSNEVGKIGRQNAFINSSIIGLVFESNNSNLFSPAFGIDNSMRCKLEALIKESSDYIFSVNLSRLMAIHPQNSQSVIPFEFLFSIRNSIESQIIPKNITVSKMGSGATMQAFLIASISSRVPDGAFNLVVNDAKKNLLKSANLKGIQFNGLKDADWSLKEVGDNVFPLFRGIWNNGYCNVANAINEIVGDGGTLGVEFECIDVIDGFMQSTVESKIVAHVFINGSEHCSIDFTQTSCPAMAIGWLSFALGLEVSPYIKISSRKG
jgi:hypothetical protein